MINEFSSRTLGIDNMNDEECIENLVSDKWCEIFHTAEVFKEYIQDFGGGIKGLSCRAILMTCESSAENLLSLLGLSKSKRNKEDAEEIIALCQNALNNSAYSF